MRIKRRVEIAYGSVTGPVFLWVLRSEQLSLLPPALRLHYTSNFGPVFETYSQWHSDGLEIESPDFSLGQCQGTFKSIGSSTFKLFHVGWLPGGGPNGSVRFVLRELNTVSPDGNRFHGTYDQKFLDADGNLVLEDTGTLRATRISVDGF